MESSDRAAAKVVLSLYKEVLGSVPLVSHRLIQLKLTDDPLTSQSPAQLVDFPKKCHLRARRSAHFVLTSK